MDHQEFDIDAFFQENMSHIGGMILSKLDNLSLLQCMLVNHRWLALVKRQRFVWLRQIQHHRRTTPNEVALHDLWLRLQSGRRTAVGLEQLCSHIRDCFGENLKLESLTDRWLPPDRSNALRTLFIYGSFERFNFCIDYLDSEEINLPSKGAKSCLHHVAKVGNLELYQRIQGQVEDQDPKDGQGRTPLFYALFFGNQQGKSMMKWSEGQRAFVQFMLKQSRPRNPKDNKGKSLLHYAAETGDMPLYQLLASKTDEVNPRDDEGYTPLHFASYHIFKHIRDCISDKNPLANNGDSVAHSAAKRGHTENLRYLFSKSFEIMSENDEKLLPSDVAFANGQMEAFEYLKMLFGAQTETNFVKAMRKSNEM